MKKLCIFLCGCVVVLPAGAENTFPNGMQFGVGVSGTGGLNVFAGYYNNSLLPVWLRYFGFRIDFASSEPIKSAIDSAIDHYMRDGISVGDGVKIPFLTAC